MSVADRPSLFEGGTSEAVPVVRAISNGVHLHRPVHAEHEELAAVLRSGIFARSPSLAHFLQYICSKHFEGKAEEIKEYNVAVEALGRPPNFDQKKDSIVRVEAHRLRKRLQEYYAGEGAGHDVQITIPAGTYAPLFVHAGNGNGHASTLASTLESDAAEPAPLVARRPISRRIWLVVGCVAIAVLVGLPFLSSRVTHARPPVARTLPIAAADLQDEIRIMAGSSAPKYVDDNGDAWTADQFFQGGESKTATPRPIMRTRDPRLFFTRREGDFRYDVPLKPGRYEVRLYFAETLFGENNVAGGGESSRVFAIKLNGRDLFFPADIVSDANGPNTADIKVYKDVEPMPDGKMHFEFFQLFKERPFVNAIEIVPGLAGRMHPIHLSTAEKGFTDAANNEWLSDRYFVGGQLVKRQEPIAGADDQQLYQTERYGNFSYSIPVAADSRYTVKLRFSEHWFGPGRNGGGTKGMRLFDVYCNGRTLMKNFDIYAEAGSLKAVEKTFRGIEPNAQGKLRLDFVPVRNYALINAIEVVDEGR